MQKGLILVALLVAGGPAAAQSDYNFRYDGRDVHVPSGCMDISCISSSAPGERGAWHRARSTRPVRTAASPRSTHREVHAAHATHVAKVHHEHAHAVHTMKAQKAKGPPAMTPEPGDETPVAAKPDTAKMPETNQAVAPTPVVAPVATRATEPSKPTVAAAPSEPKAVAAMPKDGVKETPK